MTQEKLKHHIRLLASTEVLKSKDGLVEYVIAFRGPNSEKHVEQVLEFVAELIAKES